MGELKLIALIWAIRLRACLTVFLHTSKPLHVFRHTQLNRKLISGPISVAGKGSDGSAVVISPVGPRHSQIHIGIQ